MLDHTGHKCAACHKPFKPGDDVVVCPDCGAPYHRECYKQRGACVFEDRHGTGFEWQPEPGSAPAAAPAANEIVCPRCGHVTPADSRFCKECGAPLPADRPQPEQQQAYQQAQPHAAPTGMTPDEEQAWNWQMGFLADQFDPNATIDDIPLKEWASFVGRNAPGYLAAFGQMSATGRRAGFSLSALVFGPLYFFFRKMWKWGFSFLGLEFLVTIPSLLSILVLSGSSLTAGLSIDALAPFLLLANMASVGLALFRAVFGVHLYYLHARQKIQTVRQHVAEGPARTQTLSSLGGTSLMVAVLAVLAEMLIYLTLFMTLSGPNLMNVVYALYG